MAETSNFQLDDFVREVDAHFSGPNDGSHVHAPYPLYSGSWIHVRAEIENLAREVASAVAAQMEPLEAYVEGLEAERDTASRAGIRMMAQRDACLKRLGENDDEIMRLRAERDRLRAALSHYGDHTNCNLGTDIDNGECTCGFTAALRGANEPTAVPPGWKEPFVYSTDHCLKHHGQPWSMTIKASLWPPRVVCPLCSPPEETSGCAPGPNPNIKVEEL